MMNWKNELMELDITTRAQEDVSILEVRGEIDLYSSTMLRDYVFNLIQQHHPRILIVELTDVTYIDSSGIATLVEGLQLANKTDTRFKIAGLSQRVLEVFELVKLERVFDIYTSIEEAMGDSGE
jgi:anti-sigma B factor antagonist